ncbi:energy transducer TonB [Saprospiraceae bacterium]|nr:energy transducer TonB [Saprospiraceae bacterium]
MKQQDKMILLDQWKSGVISAEDQRKLELAALDDDFLFEAMEGFLSISNQKVKTTHLSDKLAKRVADKTGKTRNMWLPAVGVAASLLLLASIFWWNGNSTNMMMAENSKKESLESNDDRSYASNIELENTTQPTAGGVPLKEYLDAESSPQNNSKSVNKNTLKGNDETIKDQEFTEEQKRKSQELLKDFMAQKPTVQSTKVEAKSSGISNTNSKQSTLESPEDEESERVVMIGDLNAEDYLNEEVIAMDESEIPASQAPIVKSEEDMVITTSIPPPPPPAASEEQVLVSKKKSGADLRKIEAASHRAEKKAIEEVKVSDFGSIKYQFAPIDGWEKFDKYIDKTKVKSVTATHTNIKGKVIVEFTIDSEGYPKDIKIVESVDTSLNEDAKKLIRFGGKWLTNDDERKIRYVINY